MIYLGIDMLEFKIQKIFRIRAKRNPKNKNIKTLNLLFFSVFNAMFFCCVFPVNIVHAERI